MVQFSAWWFKFRRQQRDERTNETKSDRLRREMMNHRTKENYPLHLSSLVFTLVFFLSSKMGLFCFHYFPQKTIVFLSSLSNLRSASPNQSATTAVWLARYDVIDQKHLHCKPRGSKTTPGNISVIFPNIPPVIIYSPKPEAVKCFWDDVVCLYMWVCVCMCVGVCLCV